MKNKFQFQLHLGDHISWQLIIDYKFLNKIFLYKEI